MIGGTGSFYFFGLRLCLRFIPGREIAAASLDAIRRHLLGQRDLQLVKFAVRFKVLGSEGQDIGAGRSCQPPKSALQIVVVVKEFAAGAFRNLCQYIPCEHLPVLVHAMHRSYCRSSDPGCICRDASTWRARTASPLGSSELMTTCKRNAWSMIRSN